METVLLVDRLNGLEIRGDYIATRVRFAHEWATSVEEAIAFANRMGLPEHGLLVRRDPDEPVGMVKGIVEDSVFRSVVEETLAASPDGRAFIESDLRAHRNPVRMDAIRAATLDLVARVRVACPSCSVPGFQVTDDRPGLPCRTNGTEAFLTLALVSTGQVCGHQVELMYPHGTSETKPGECPHCNP